MLKGHTHVVECIAFSHPNAERAISGKLTLATENEMKIDENKLDNDTVTTHKNNRMSNNTANIDIVKVEIGPPQYIVSGSRDKNVIIWSLKSGMALITLVCVCVLLRICGLFFVF